MASKFKNKYRIESTRLRQWDYSQPGSYFITAVTKNRKLFFGEIIDEKMILNELGKIAESCWLEIPSHFSNVVLGEHQVMPDHFHGIIHILDGDDAKKFAGIGFIWPLLKQEMIHPPEAVHPRFRNQGKGTVSAIFGSYKSAVSKRCHLIDPEFGWQSRFKDDIIRTEEANDRIENYIRRNPAMWGKKKK